MVVCLWAGLRPAQASDIQAERSALALDISKGVEVLVDPGARLTLPDVLAQSAAFQQWAHGTALNFGYTDAAVWLRLRIAAAADAPRDWRLVIAYPTLDRVDFFYPNGSNYLQLASGDHLPYSQRAVPHRELVFPLTLTPGQTSTVYLRLQSQGTLTVPMQILQREAFEHDSEFQYAALGVYYGALLILVFFGALMYVALREPIFINYAGYILFSIDNRGTPNRSAAMRPWEWVISSSAPWAAAACSMSSKSPMVTEADGTWDKIGESMLVTAETTSAPISASHAEMANSRSGSAATATLVLPK